MKRDRQYVDYGIIADTTSDEHLPSWAWMNPPHPAKEGLPPKKPPLGAQHMQHILPKKQRTK